MYSIFMHGRSGMTIAIRPSHPYNAGTEHVGFSQTRQALLVYQARSAVRWVFGKLHEGEGFILQRITCEAKLEHLLVRIFLGIGSSIESLSGGRGYKILIVSTEK